MVSKATNTEFYLSQLRRIAKSINVKLSRKAFMDLAKHLEKHTKFILKRASFFASKERRKIIKVEDIKEAMKEGILFQ